MKKFYLLGCCLMICAWVAAPVYAINLDRVAQELRKKQPVRQLFEYAKTGDVEALRNLLENIDKQVLLQKDLSTGNNVLHAASDTKTFALFWNALSKEDREKLLMQQNKAGETPFVRQLSYNNPFVVLSYLPQTELYRQMRSVTQNLQRGSLPKETAMQQAEIVRLTSNAAGQNLYQIAGMFTNQENKSRAEAMAHVRDTIAHAAPFLKK